MLVNAAAAAAVPGGVVYLKGQQVWASKYDGSLKVQISSGDAWWNEVAVSTSGGIAGTKVEPGKGGQYSLFTIWNPDGTVKDEGPASPGTNFSGGTLASPLGLELTPSNSALLFGYSQYIYGFPVGTLNTGYAILPSVTRTTGSSSAIPNTPRWPSLIGGNRVIASDGGSSILVESAVGNIGGPFTTWSALDLNSSNLDYEQVTASDDGTIVGAQFRDTNATGNDERVKFAKTTGLLGAYVDDCDAPMTGETNGVDVSADGTLVAWADADGVKIAPTPNLRSGGPATCEFSSAPMLLEAGASHPAIGPVDVDAIYAARNPGTPGTPGTPSTPAPVVTVPKALTAARLTAGTTLTVKVAAKGKVAVSITIAAKSVGRKGKAIVIATSTATAREAGQIKVRLKSTKTGRALKKKLRGKRVKLTIKAGGKITVKVVKLR